MAVKPPLKWAGSKVRVMPELLKHLPAGKRLVEPFAGSCAVMMNTDYDSYLIADANHHLVNTYMMMARHTDALLVELEELFAAGSVGSESQRGAFYYCVRNHLNHGAASSVELAACFLYLNRHAYNGLCRYNLRGEFNVPYGKYKSPYFPLAEIRAFAVKAKRATFLCTDFTETLELVVPGDVVYCDPPYNPERGKASFTKYHSADFDAACQQRLAAMLVTGYADRVLRWFTGYVERSQPAETGYQRLFVRELSGVFDRSWPCSFQHPTLRQITAWLEENSGLTFSVPAADYSDKPIPHFTHSGTGFQLLGNLGRAFGISDYVWYQLPDGGMYAGGAEKSLFAGRPVDIPPEFSLGAAGGNSMTIPVIQSMRPGVELNGQRVTKVQLAGDTMTITWTPRNRTTGQPLQKTPLQRQIESQYPEMASGLHLPKMARVVASSEAVSTGNFADPFRPRYAVDVQLLDADGKPDGSTPVYPAVPLPVPMAGNDSGMFQFPPEGTLVEVGFTGGRPDKPFVRQTMPEGTSLPDVKPGEQLQQQREEVSQRVTQAGDWERKTDQAIRETSMAREVKADSETRELVSRTTTIKATDKTTVLGTASLMAGAVQQVTTGSYSMAAQGDQLITVGGNTETDITGSAAITVGQALTEKIGHLRQSIAGTRQEIIAPVVWIGSAQINVAQLMLDTVALVEQLANQLASHTHPDTGQPTNSAAIAQSGQQAAALNTKYSPVIGQ